MTEPIPNAAQRPPPLYAQALERYTSSAPSSAPLPNSLNSRPGISNSGVGNRPSSGPGALQSQNVSLPSAAMPRSGGYRHSFHPSATSPGTALSGYSDFGPPHAPFLGAPNMSPTAQVSAAGIQGQKRAYRQRRKDPSCDACRERKVKVRLDSVLEMRESKC